MGRVLEALYCLLCFLMLSLFAEGSEERTLAIDEISNRAIAFQSDLGDSGEFTFWLPAGADELVLPIAAGIVVDTSNQQMMKWLRQRSPWNFLELPALGLRHGQQMVVVIAPWPHYAHLLFEDDRIGVRFSHPPGRHNAAPIEIVALRLPSVDPLEVARQFRRWRETSPSTGDIPRPRSLHKKVADLAIVERLFGAPHCYLWGPSLFSRHDVPSIHWQKFAEALDNATPGSFIGKLVGHFSDEHRTALEDVVASGTPSDYQANHVAMAIDQALSRSDLVGPGSKLSRTEVIQRNKEALADALSQYVNPPETWGDGFSKSMLNTLHGNGVERALLVLGGLSARSPRPDVAAHAEKLGYLVGPYDSYHSIHSPEAETTWRTAQFDQKAYEHGRVINVDGSGNSGFMGHGFHFSPQAAWPYVQQRVGEMLDQTEYSTWFVDCDATAECFDDFNPLHPATKADDAAARRHRLTWLESQHDLVVGSEAGSALFADVIHYGHGVHTPYIGHLDRAFRDKNSPHFLGNYWPPNMPEKFFRPATVPPRMRSPYFDPTVRVPLYQAALGDELITTHHWIFSSTKFTDIAATRELLEILYMVPPMYHLNRETWPRQSEHILKHLAFWSPLHRKLAPAPLTQFEYLSEDRLVQRTTFQTEQGNVSITVNFGQDTQAGCPPRSALIAGAMQVSQSIYNAR
ncbi:glycoside hydrolase [Pirellulales bacterium]|nr:glycoside hydrolase [Pirellulales bacterium]